MNAPQRVYVALANARSERVEALSRRLQPDSRIVLGRRVEADGGKSQVSRVDCDLTDPADVCRAVGAVTAESADGDHVYVNVASERCLSTVGATLGCLVTEATLVHPAAGESDHEGPPVPALPVATPTPEQAAVLDYVGERSEVTKKELIEYGRETGLSFVTDCGGGRKSRYRALETNIVDPLTERGYLSVRAVGRQHRVTLTATGKRARRTFAYLA